MPGMMCLHETMQKSEHSDAPRELEPVRKRLDELTGGMSVYEGSRIRNKHHQS